MKERRLCRVGVLEGRAGAGGTQWDVGREEDSVVLVRSSAQDVSERNGKGMGA